MQTGIQHVFALLTEQWRTRFMSVVMVTRNSNMEMAGVMDRCSTLMKGGRQKEELRRETAK